MNRTTGASTLLALFFAALLSACATFDVPPLSPVEELDTVPFHAQERYQCGPAALLTVLEASGVASDLPSMVRQVYVPGREGSLQAELVAATRAAGRVPYRIDGTPAALHAELDAGRPVLVLQNLGISLLPRWHYAVVVGLDTTRNEVVLRSGTERRRVTPLRTFLHTWSRGENWALVALRPEELPANVNATRWFRALTALEQTGHADIAAAAWAAATVSFPASPVAWFGHANALYAGGQFAAAEAAYREMLAIVPREAAARNNLAMSLLRQGKIDEAGTEARAALADAADDASLRAEIAATLQEIGAAR